MDLSEELARIEDDDSLGSLSDEEISGVLQNDTWIEELECALLADCGPTTLKKITDGRRIPASLRPDYWRTLLALNDTGRVKLSNEYDLPNQLEIRLDCEKLVQEIANDTLDHEAFTDADKLRLISDFESTITTYVKARPELIYISDNGWTDILKVLHRLELDISQLYQIFFRIVDRYIPKDLCSKPVDAQPGIEKSLKIDEMISKNPSANVSKSNLNPKVNRTSFNDQNFKTKIPNDYEKSVQAYHLLRLLIQYHDPELCSILDSKKVLPNLYVKDWFCTLFARSCSSSVAILIWDTHFKMADPFLIFFAAIVMVVNASDKLKKKLSQSEMLKVLKSMPSKLEEDDIEDLYYLVSNHYTNSTPRSIRSYSHLFFMDTFGNTYLGNESPEDGQPLLDLKTTRLTSSLDLAQYLCLPVVPAEIFALDTAHLRSSPTHSTSALRYFLVDCRPAEQYNAGHLTKAFHLDCSLMLREPSSFATAVQALLEIQRQIVASKSNTGGQHLCFIGSGQEEEDQYVNMVVASFLQRHQRYVSIVYGGFDAIHDYVKTKSELKDSFDELIVDHNADLCKACYSKSPDGYEKFKALTKQTESSVKVSSTGSIGNSAQSLFASTTSFFRGDKGPLSSATAGQLISQSSATIFDNFTKAFVTKSNVIKDRLVETLNTASLPSSSLTSMTSSGSSKSHVSSQDKLGKRYMGGNSSYSLDDNDQDLIGINKNQQPIKEDVVNEPIQEVQIDTWQKDAKIISFFKCVQIKGNAKYPGYIALSKTHLWILREIPHNKGFASIAARRPLEMIVQITSKRTQPDFIIFRYGYSGQLGSSEETNLDPSMKTETLDKSVISKSGKTSITVIDSDHLQISQAFEIIRLIKRELVRIMDENANSSVNVQSNPTEPESIASNSEETAESLKSAFDVEDKINLESNENNEAFQQTEVTQ